MDNKLILLIGGSGSLGNAFITKNIDKNHIYVYSRDECKHWNMQLIYKNHPNLHFIIGDINNRLKMEETLLRYKFNIIINAAAMKHVDKCEYEINECLNVNIAGTQNLVNLIETHKYNLTSLECCCFISTDKACSPVNVYGMSKAIAETLYIEKSKFVPEIKFVCVRYGNVLNSRGSIIPMLHEIGNSVNHTEFKITDEHMTRFVMTLEQSVDLIEHACVEGESGDIVISKLVSCKIKDLIDIFSEHYNKPIRKIPIRPGEKLLESLINITQSDRLIQSTTSEYMYIKPSYKNTISNCIQQDYNSDINPMTKFVLRMYLHKLCLLRDVNFQPINFIVNNISFKETKPFPYVIIKDILECDFAMRVQNEILSIEPSMWDRYDNELERKFTLRDKDNLPCDCNKLFTILTSNIFLNHLSTIAGVKVINDPTKNWWGIHKFTDGDSLDIHVDAGIHPTTKQKKHLTLGIYLSKNWKEENGGHLEIWEGSNCSHNPVLIQCCDRILPVFNTGLLFENNDVSWHGSPSRIVCRNGEQRIFLTVSYLSDSREYHNTYQKACFIKRPGDSDDPVKDELRKRRCDILTYKNVL